MPRLILVRHGRAAQGWEVPDPGLDGVGRVQATTVAEVLAGQVARRPIVTSPLARCRETAAPLAARWGVEPSVEPAVSELPSPRGVAVTDRPDWLRSKIGGTWTGLGPPFLAYRDGVLAALSALAVDTVVVSHFIAINAAIGAAVGDDRLVLLRLDNASRTTLDVDGGRFTLVEGGEEADTLIR